jgi:hypothetical protein
MEEIKDPSLEEGVTSTGHSLDEGCTEDGYGIWVRFKGFT